MMKPISYACLLLAAVFLSACQQRKTLEFPTPEEAVRAIADASEDRVLAEKLLGDGGFELLRSGDDVADQEDLEQVRKLIDEKIEIEAIGEDVTVALLGHEGWELPIPLRQSPRGWSFDVEAGREEILARRIGRNEILTIATLRALVEAQREYASVGRDGQPRAFASKLWSSEGMHDGLFWPVAEGEPESPVGPLIAEASEEGYQRSEAGPRPYHGYRFRLLRKQGAHAPGGAHSYVDDQGLLTAGFAVLAYPATYDNSGVMTFVVNQQGIIFQRDLGSNTEEQARALEAYDPDAQWDPCVDS